MKQKRSLTIKRQAQKDIEKGNPLLQEVCFPNQISFEEGEIVELVGERGEFVAQAYMAKQNKGVGWVFSLNQNEDFDQSFFLQQFQHALKQRKRLMEDNLTNTFRLFNGEGDGIPGVTIDYYAGYVIISWYSEGIYRYQEEILVAFKEVFSDLKGMYEKYRYQRQDGQTSKFIYGEEAEAPLVVQENGLHFAVYLDQGWMTGIFLDQREVRQALQDKYAPGKSVLNTFSYTGAFSVAAAMGGASHTVSVDVSNRSKEKTKEQFTMNGLNPEEETIRVMDVFDYIQFAKRKGLQFDVIVVDPPSFARTKKRVFSVSKDYGGMIEDLIDISAPDAVFILASNSASYKRKDFKADIATAFRNKKQTYTVLEEYRLPEDFPIPKGSQTSDYLKVSIVQKQKKS